MSAPSWRWEVVASEPAHPFDRYFTDCGVVEAESMGEVVAWLAEHGPFWGVLAEDRPVTFTVEPERREPSPPTPGHRL